MGRRILAVALTATAIAPGAASAQYDDGDYSYRRPHDHVEIYRHGDHDDVVVRHHHPHRDDARFDYGERRRHHHHDDDE